MEMEYMLELKSNVSSGQTEQFSRPISQAGTARVQCGRELGSLTSGPPTLA